MQVAGGRAPKQDRRFPFPARMDLRKYCTEAAINDAWAKSTEYKLVGVLAHVGAADHGHIVYYQEVSSNEWWMRNDNEPVRSLTKKAVMALQNEAVGLVYTRRPPSRCSNAVICARCLLHSLFSRLLDMRVRFQ